MLILDDLYLYGNALLQFLDMTDVFLFRLHVDGDVCIATESVTQFMFDERCVLMRFLQGSRTVHPYMHLDCNAVAQASGAKVMRVNDIGHRPEDRKSVV